MKVGLENNAAPERRPTILGCCDVRTHRCICSGGSPTIYRVKGAILIDVFPASIISWPRGTRVIAFSYTGSGDAAFDSFKKVVTFHPIKLIGNAIDSKFAKHSLEVFKCNLEAPAGGLPRSLFSGITVPIALKQTSLNCYTCYYFQPNARGRRTKIGTRSYRCMGVWGTISGKSLC